MRWVAPGKVVLLGEYAVLDGAPAVVMAVDSGVACAFQEGGALRIEAPDDRFVRPALEAAGAPAGTYRFTPHRPLPTRSKPGLGSSAAATVVAVRAGLELQGAPADPEQVRALAHRVHRQVQGSGSGIDVAASAVGGILRFQDGRCTRLAAPAPLVVWSGSSAATGPRVARYLAWPQRDAFVAASRQLVHAFPDAPIPTLLQATRLLDHMASSAALPYWTDGLREITRLAEDCGGAAKPSGAGGGDSAVALLPDPEAEVTFRRRCQARGLQVLDLRPAPPCARVPQAS